MQIRRSLSWKHLEAESYQERALCMHAPFLFFLPQLLKGRVDEKRAQLGGLLAWATIPEELLGFFPRLMTKSSFIEPMPINTRGIGSGFQLW